MKLVVSIVNYHKAARVVISVGELCKCLDLADVDYVISIIDNSVDPEQALLLDGLRSSFVSVVVNSENVGYTRATNESVRGLSFDYLLILNPDILMPTGFDFSRLINKADNEIFSVLSVAQVNDDGEEYSVVRNFPNLLGQIAKRVPMLKSIRLFNSALSRYMNQIDGAVDKSGCCEWTQSSFWLIKYEVWDSIGGLDERFFLFMSDPDFCLQAKLAHGLDAYYFHEMHVVADGLRASDGGIFQVFTSFSLRCHIRDAIRYYFKWRGN